MCNVHLIVDACWLLVSMVDWPSGIDPSPPRFVKKHAQATKNDKGAANCAACVTLSELFLVIEITVTYQ